MIITLLVGQHLATVGVFEGSTVLQTSQSFAGAFAAAGYGDDESDNERPYAYLNYILFDDNIEMVDAGWQRVEAAAGFDAGEEALPNRHVRLSFSEPIFATGSGYIYIWVSNESEVTEVWFDDVKVTHTQTLVTQATDYGVWGDVLREMKAAEFTYRYGYQGQFAEKDEETGWNHFELREYDPVIGRWLVPDPLKEFKSPYLSMKNNPISRVDPTGGCTDPRCIQFMKFLQSLNRTTPKGGGQWEVSIGIGGGFRSKQVILQDMGIDLGADAAHLLIYFGNKRIGYQSTFGSLAFNGMYDDIYTGFEGYGVRGFLEYNFDNQSLDGDYDFFGYKYDVVVHDSESNNLIDKTLPNNMDTKVIDVGIKTNFFKWMWDGFKDYVSGFTREKAPGYFINSSNFNE